MTLNRISHFAFILFPNFYQRCRYAVYCRVFPRSSSFFVRLVDFKL